MFADQTEQLALSGQQRTLTKEHVSDNSIKASTTNMAVVLCCVVLAVLWAACLLLCCFLHVFQELSFGFVLSALSPVGIFTYRVGRAGVFRGELRRVSYSSNSDGNVSKNGATGLAKYLHARVDIFVENKRKVERTAQQNKNFAGIF